MIEVLPESENDTLAVVISGELTPEDYDKLEPELSLRAERERSFDVIVELNEVEGLELEAIKDELDFAQRYSENIDRLAVVSDSTWWRRITGLLSTPMEEFLGVETSQFDDRVDAWKWLKDQ